MIRIKILRVAEPFGFRICSVSFVPVEFSIVIILSTVYTVYIIYIQYKHIVVICQVKK
jgi:hypothetical protein